MADQVQSQLAKNDAENNCDRNSSIENKTTNSPLQVVNEANKSASNTDAASDDGENSISGEGEQELQEIEWDHSSRKVIVHRVMKVRRSAMEKMIQSWLDTLDDPSSIKVEKFRKPPMDSWVTITLQSESMVKPFLSLMNSKKFTNRRGEDLYAEMAKGRNIGGGNSDSNNKRGKKRSMDENENEGTNKRLKDEVNEQEQVQKPKTADEIRDKTTPLWRKSYDDQVRSKFFSMVNKCGKKIVKELDQKFKILAKEAKRNPKQRKPVPKYKWMNNQITIEHVIASPNRTEYRNKTEMTFGYRIEKTEDGSIKKIPSVGFMAAGWNGGVSRPHCCQHITDEVCVLADLLEEFLGKSHLLPYDPVQRKGFWRTVMIRTSRRTGECMIVIVHAPPKGGVSGTEDFTPYFETENKRLVDLLTTVDLHKQVRRDYPDLPLPSTSKPPQSTSSSDNLKDDENSNIVDPKTKPIPMKIVSSRSSFTACPIQVSSIFFQEFDGLSMPPPEHPFQHAHGKKSIKEKLGSCTFQISPGAFFQVNTECAELLYNVVVDKIREMGTKAEETLLFDVCCGTGTIGLTCLKEGVVGKVVGVDISEPAIADAKINAELNGFDTGAEEGSEDQKTKFVASRAEHVAAKEMSLAKKTSQSVIAVVDPAREGLHPDVIRTLRSNQKISRLIYVSCNPEKSLPRDACLLCAPPTKKYSGCAFRPTSAQPVDMFPLTNHCEMVMTFDRLQDDS